MILQQRIGRWRGRLAMRLGRIGATSPLSRDFGFSRGTPIDRFYIESFLADHQADVHGAVLEIGDDSYSRRFGGSRISRQDVLHVNPFAGATIVGDLMNADTLPAGQFDCIILTQTLHLLPDMPVAIANLHRALRPGGALLVTSPGITPIDRDEWADNWLWSLTGASLKHLLCGPFARDRVQVSVYGNLFAATAFLHGAALEEVGKARLAAYDPAYPVIVAAAARA